MRISDRQIGNGHPPYIIAELGVNHDGSVERALELTRAAADAGADAVKLQLFDADRLLSRAARLAAYQRSAGEADPLAMLRRLQLPLRDMEAIIAAAHALGLHAIVTVFSVELAADADRLPWDGYKTASPDIIHRPLLNALAATGRPLIVSTGAATLGEVRRAADWLTPAHERLALLQCVSSYPTVPGDEELGGIAAIRGVFAGPVGYSDHTPAIETGARAVRAGAVILEKHLTYDRRARGPDHAASLEPGELREYVRLARAAAAGDGAVDLAAESSAASGAAPSLKRILPCEVDVRRLSRQSLTTARPLPAGHLLRPGDVTIKRPGTGIEPWRLDEIIGRRTTRALDADMPIMPGDAEGGAERLAAAGSAADSRHRGGIGA